MVPHFNKVEKIYFLHIMNEVLPLGVVEWETVANQYDKKYTAFPHIVDSIKYQFYNLFRAISLISIPNILEKVLLACKIK